MGRSLRVRIDAGRQYPETRSEFRHPLIEEYPRNNRGLLVGALVTLARATAKLPDDAPIVGGFEDFSGRIGAILCGIGVKGFLGDRNDISALSDQETALIQLVEGLGSSLPGRSTHDLAARPTRRSNRWLRFRTVLG